MNNWIIKNYTQHKFVSESGSYSSFTDNILRARQYPTQEAAKADCCGDEIAVQISTYF